MKRLFLSFVLSSSAPLMVELKECIFLIKGVGTRSRVILSSGLLTDVGKCCMRWGYKRIRLFKKY